MLLRRIEPKLNFVENPWPIKTTKGPDNEEGVVSFEGEAGAAVAAAGAGRRSEVERFSTIASPAMTRGPELPGAAKVPASLQLKESDFEYCVGFHSSQTVQTTMVVC